MFAIQPIHIMLIVLVALLFFAPSRLPLLGRGFSRMIGEFRREVGSGKKMSNDAENANSPKGN